jgi:mono/diheme cytochrome c family protein
MSDPTADPEARNRLLPADGVGDDAPDEPGAGDSVQALHEAVMREQAEPRDGFEPVPFWVAVVCGGLLAWGGYYIGSYTADFRADVYDRADLKDVAPPATAGPDPNPKTRDELKSIGEQKYIALCVGCHGTDGKGLKEQPGKYPPLAASEWVVGDKATPARLSRILLYGLKDPLVVQGKTYNDLMPARGAELRDYQIAGLITYIRNSFGNEGDKDNAKPAVTADEVKAARAKEGTRKANGTAPYTADELMKVTEPDLKK